MTIDFEKDQQDAMKKTDNIQSLADQVERLEGMQQQLEVQENAVKEKKKQIEHISGEVIPTMMTEMGLSELKLSDGSHLKVATSYKAHISEANKEAAYNWLRNNGLGDIIKNEISVSFGKNEDNAHQKRRSPPDIISRDVTVSSPTAPSRRHTARRPTSLKTLLPS